MICRSDHLPSPGVAIAVAGSEFELFIARDGHREAGDVQLAHETLNSMGDEGELGGFEEIFGAGVVVGWDAGNMKLIQERVRKSTLCDRGQAIKVRQAYEVRKGN